MKFTLLEQLPGASPQKSIIDINYEDLLEEAIKLANDNPHIKYSIIDEAGGIVWSKDDAN